MEFVVIIASNNPTFIYTVLWHKPTLKSKLNHSFVPLLPVITNKQWI